MKQKLILLLVAWLPIAAFCDKLTVHVETEGTLEEVITNQDVLKITDLTITGRITAADIKYLRDLKGRIINLESLDLRDVTLVASDESYSSHQYLIGDPTVWPREYGYIYYFLNDEEENRSNQVLGMNLAGAFMGMTTLKHVVLPKGTKKVGQRCFSGCTSLESVELPDGITAIEDYAFSSCNVLESLDIPTLVTSIGEMAFYNCASLTSVGSLSNVTEIRDNAFSRCTSLASIGSISNVQILGKEVFDGCNALQGKVEFNAGLTEIPQCSFRGCSITEIVFPSSLKTIGESAFYGCTSLSSLSFPSGSTLESIEDKAFYKCDALEVLLLPEGLLTIGSSAFADCKILAEVSLPSTLHELQFSSFEGTPWQDAVATEDNGMMVIGNVAVACYLDNNFEPNTTLVFREGIISIADGFKIYWRNKNRTDGITRANVTDVSFPSTLEYIGNESFNNFTGLTKLVLPASLKKIGYDAFPSTIESVNLPEGLEEIGGRAFDYCSKIEEIKLPSTLKRIGQAAFVFCTGLSQITIPESLEVLETCDLAADHGRTIYNVGPFYGCQGIIIVRMNAKNLADRSEMGELAGLEKIIIGSNVEVLPGELFSNTPMKVEFEERSKDSRLHLERYCLGRSLSKLSSLSLPDCKISLGNGVFSGFKGTIEILGEITSIAANALSGCSSLTSVRLSDELTEIPYQAFYGCSGLTSINVPDGVTYIDKYAFQGCSGLTSVTIPASVTSINSYAFSGCSGLTAVHISDIAAWCGISFPVDVASSTPYYSNPLVYAHHLYLNDEEIKDLVIPDGVTSIGEYAFNGCSSLTSVTIPDGVTSIGEYAFNGCSGFTSVTIPNSVTSIGSYAFYGCSGLTSVTIGSGVTSIDSKAFNGCDNITSVISFIERPFSIQENNQAPFSCYDDATLYVPAGTRQTYLNTSGWKKFKVIREGDGTWPEDAIAFTDTDVEKTCVRNWDTNGDGYLSYDEAAAVEEMKDQGGYNLFPSTITSFEEMKYFTGLKIIGDKVFKNCSSLTSVTIPASVTSIGSSAFYGCSGLAEVTIPASVTSIGSSAFYGCSGLTVVHISDLAVWCGISFSSYSNPLVYAKHLYLNDEEIKDLVIPNGVTSIGDYAFNSCNGLTSMTIPACVTSIGNDAFDGCNSLTSVTSCIKEPFEINYFTFGSSYDKATLYVPAGTSGKYHNVYSWSSFTNIVEMISAVLGDADGDGVVGQDDIDLIVDYILTGVEPEGFVFKNADMDGNENVDVNDIVKIVNIIESKKSTGGMGDLDPESPGPQHDMDDDGESFD